MNILGLFVLGVFWDLVLFGGLFVCLMLYVICCLFVRFFFGCFFLGGGVGFF